MFKLITLAAPEPLTKTIWIDESGGTHKSNYPPVYHFTSTEHTITDLAGFFRTISNAASAGHCLLKGSIKRPLVHESRAGATDSDDVTHWCCLDIDGLTGFKSIADFMDHHPKLHDISYIVQYSSSSGLSTARGLHAHVFMMLSHPYHATYLKGWLTRQNVDGELFEGKVVKQLTLTRTQSALHYPIDITACQNDKLIYIAPPIIKRGVKYTPPKDGYIQLIKKAHNLLPIEHLEHGSVETWKTEARRRFNILRKEAGLETVRGRGTNKDGFHIEPECGEFQITEQRVDGDWMRFNMNGGDSWSWYHPLGNHKYVHCFKGDLTYRTEWILPAYFKRCEHERKRANQEPSVDGEILLAFRDIRTAKYHNGVWNPITQVLTLDEARSEIQLDHFLQQHGRPPGAMEFVPQWRIEFDPHSEVVVDLHARKINTYVPTEYFRLDRQPARNLDRCPTIRRIIYSAVSSNAWSEITEHFLNWLAVIFQHKVKTRTAWVLHGTEGTGKGLIVYKVLTPLLGRRYVQPRRMSELEERYTAWLEDVLIALIDEAQISSSAKHSLITGDLKNFITDPVCTFRHMNRVSYLADSYVNFLFFSQKDDPVTIDEEDRRFNVGDYQPTPLPITDADVETIETELPHFMDYIMQREADINRAGQVMRSKSRDNIINASKNSVDLLASALRDGDLNPFVEAMPDIRMLAEIAGASSAVGVQYSNIVLRELHLLTDQRIVEKDGFFHASSRLSRDELFILFEHAIGGMAQSPAKFSRMLKHKHLELKKIRVDELSQMGITVEWVASREWVDANRPPAPDPKVVNLAKRKKT
jgi:hypothetical protein